MSEVHEGHRERMKARVEMGGLEALMPHEVIEYLLYFSVPRRDVNELAHTLINAFGSVNGVLSASERDLLNVPYVGVRTARWLKALKPVLESYKALTLSDRPQLSTRARAEAYARSLAKNDARAAFTWVFMLNAGGYLLYADIVAKNAYWASPASLGSIVVHAIKYRAHSVVVTSYRNAKNARAGEYDKKGVDALNARLCAVGVNLMDYMIISPDDMCSMRQSVGIPSKSARADEASLHETWLSED